MEEEEAWEVDSVVDDLLATVAEATTVPPVVYPLWPDDPSQIAVGVAVRADDTLQIVVPPSREEMLLLRYPGRLWFVLPRSLVADVTTWEPVGD